MSAAGSHLPLRIPLKNSLDTLLMIGTQLLRRTALLASVVALGAGCSGGSDDPTEPGTPEISITAGSSAITVEPNSSGTVQLTVGRSGSFTGAVNLAAEGLPTGVTATFAPASLTSGTTSVLTVAAGENAATGTSNFTVRATGQGVTAKSVQIALTVSDQPGLTLALSAAAVSVAQGATGQSVVTLTRTGGLAGNVTMALEGAPAGVTGTFDPNPATGAASTLTLDVPANIAVGAYNLTVRGTGAGSVTATAPLQLTVTAGASGNIAWQFCDASRVPAWFAYRDGTSGAWTRVTPGANNTFAFTLAQAVGGVAYVLQEGAATELEVYYLTPEEMAFVAQSECTANVPAGKTLNGTVQGVGENELATIAMGGTYTTDIATDYVLQDVAQGTQDLLGVRGTAVIEDEFVIGIVPNRMVLMRNQNVTDNGTLPVVNFNDGSSFAPATATMTFTNTGGTPVFTFQSWVTATQVINPYMADLFPLEGNTMTFHGVPTARLLAGELHELFAMTGNEDATEGRMVQTYFRDVAAKTVAFGPVLGAPNITSSTSNGVAVPRAQGTFQAEYDAMIGVSFVQENLHKAVTVAASKTYFGTNATQYDLQTPDLTPVTGFNPAWGLTPGVTTLANISAIGAEGGQPGTALAATAWMLDARRAATGGQDGSAAKATAASSSSSIPMFQIVAGLILLLAFRTLTFTA